MMLNTHCLFNNYFDSELKTSIKPATIPTKAHDQGLADMAQVLPAHFTINPIMQPIIAPITVP